MTRPHEHHAVRLPLPDHEVLWGHAAPEMSATDALPRDEAELEAGLLTRLRGLDDVPVPRDAMWAAICAQRASPAVTRPVLLVERRVSRPPRWWPMITAIAATLAVGVAIGRMAATMPTVTAPRDLAATASVAPAADAELRASALRDATVEHLGRTEALLVSAQSASISLGSDRAIATWARDLLTTTRLLLDTEPPPDVRVRRLLEDLERTLALILQAHTSGRARDVQDVRADLTETDLLLRVRSAASDLQPSPIDVRGISE